MVHIHIEGPFQVEKSIQDSIYIGQIIKCILSWSTLICRAVFHIFLSRAQTEQIARRVVVISVLHVEKSKTGVFLPRVLIRHTFSISRWVTQRSVRATQRTADAETSQQRDASAIPIQGDYMQGRASVQQPCITDLTGQRLIVLRGYSR